MRALNDPPPDYTPKRTTLGALFRKHQHIWHEQLATLILPRHVLVLHEKEKTGYPVWQRVWVKDPDTSSVRVVGVTYAPEYGKDVLLGLIPDGPLANQYFRDEDFVLATEDLTPPKDSLQYRAALCIARNWDRYKEEEKERVWDRTLLTKKWKEMVTQ